MDSGKLTQTTADPESSSPAPASSTKLQAVEVQTPHQDTLESSSDTGNHQLNAGDQGESSTLPVGGLHPTLHDHPYASLDTLDVAAEVIVPGEVEQQSFPTKPQVTTVRKETKRSRNKQVSGKKPMNAFMLFMMEQRATVRASIKSRGNGAVTAHLGSVWKSLSRKEQEKYYQEAEHQRFLHQQQHSDCSTNEDDDKTLKKAKKRSLQESRDEGKCDSEESPPSNWMMLTPKHRKQTRGKDGTEIHWDMKLRPRKRPKYQE